MELIIRYGRVVGAKELCSVTWADLFCGFHDYLKVVRDHDFDTVFSQMNLCSPSRVSLDAMAHHCTCYSGVEPDCTEVPDQMFMAPKAREVNQKFLAKMVAAGVNLSGNCIPYLTGFVPLMGEHFVSCESSAVLFMNSLWGARGNGDGIEASFCAAVCGRTPKSGMHLKQNRAATLEVVIESSPRTLFDWDRLGYALGNMLPPHAVPAFTGDFCRPNAIALKTFFAALACSAGTELCHMVGMGPESPTLEHAFQKKTAHEKIRVTPRDIKAGEQELCSDTPGKIDHITLGCPHLHIDEIRRVADFLKDKKIHPETRVEIWTTGAFLYTAQRCGYAQIIEKAGAHLLTGSCPANRGYPKGIETIAFDASKQRQDAPLHLGRKNLFYGSRQTCLQSAVSGQWEGRL